MDELLRKKILILTSIFLISLIGYFNFKTYKIKQEHDNILIAINRSPLLDFRLIDYREKNGFYIDVVEFYSGQKYENVFLSLTCPEIKTKQIGLMMKLSVLEQFKPSTQETIYSLDRAYDYLCTNKNMVEEDKKLINLIKEARERNMKNQEDLLLKAIPKTE